MNRLLFIRHAETDMGGRFCGHSDPPVNARGERQISALIARLAPETIDAVYCSDLRRAVVTADALAKALSVPLTRRHGLREIGFGDWEGLTWAEIEQRNPGEARHWMEAFPNLPAPGGESFADFEARVLDEVDHLLLFAERKRFAVVTHGGVMRVVLRTLLGCSDKDAWDKTKSYCCSFACVNGVAPRTMSR